jgi:hypothetical protein
VSSKRFSRDATSRSEPAKVEADSTTWGPNPKSGELVVDGKGKGSSMVADVMGGVMCFPACTDIQGEIGKVDSSGTR